MSFRSLVLPILLFMALPLLGGCAAAVVGGAAMGAGAAHDRRESTSYFDDKRIYLGAYDAMIKTLQQQQQILAHVALKGSNTILGTVVQAAALKAAFTINN